MSANIYCRSFRNREKNGHLFCPDSSTNIVFISRQCMYIVFILQYLVFTKFLNLHTKRQKHLGVYGAFLVDHCILRFALHKTQVYYQIMRQDAKAQVYTYTFIIVSKCTDCSINVGRISLMARCTGYNVM